MKYYLLIATLSIACVNDLDEGDSTNTTEPIKGVLMPSPGHDEALKGNGKGGPGCMLKDAPNYNSSATVACTTSCVGGKTGNNCCCED